MFSHFTLNDIYKYLRVFKAFPQKCLKFISAVPSWNLKLMLVPTKTNWALEKGNYKQDALKILHAGGIKIALKFLTEVVAVYIRLFII